MPGDLDKTKEWLDQQQNPDALVEQLLEALSLRGVPEDKREEIRSMITQCLEKYPELSPELINFKDHMKWLSNTDGMISLYASLKGIWLINEKETESWTIINIDWLGYEIYKVDPCRLDNADFIRKPPFHKKWLRVDVKERRNKTNFMQDETFEISRKDLEILSWKLWQWWKVPTEADFKSMLGMLGTLWKTHSGSIKYPANIDDTWDKYNECGALFMLISKIYWIILLQNGVYKAFDKYRWFRDWQLDGNWDKLNLTGQVVLLRRKN